VSVTPVLPISVQEQKAPRFNRNRPERVRGDEHGDLPLYLTVRFPAGDTGGFKHIGARTWGSRSTLAKVATVGE